MLLYMETFSYMETFPYIDMFPYMVTVQRQWVTICDMDGYVSTVYAAVAIKKCNIDIFDFF